MIAEHLKLETDDKKYEMRNSVMDFLHRVGVDNIGGTSRHDLFSVS